MKILRTLSVELNGTEEVIRFGIPETEGEINRMHALRYEEYTRRDYIDPNRFPDGREKDECDEGDTVHFVAECRYNCVGTIRLIRGDTLPTEVDFQFTEPAEISSIPRKNRAEFGRFIIVPLDPAMNKYLPRGLLMLIMFDTLIEYCEENEIKGGYSFIKESLRKKMSALKMPFKIIKPHISRYPQTGILYKYFNQPSDPVIPIAFLTEDFKNKINKVLSNKLFFKRQNKRIVVTHSWLLRIFKRLILF